MEIQESEISTSGVEPIKLTKERVEEIRSAAVLKVGNTLNPITALFGITAMSDMIAQEYTPGDTTKMAKAELYGGWGKSSYGSDQNVYETREVLFLAKIYDEGNDYEPFYVLCTGFNA